MPTYNVIWEAFGIATVEAETPFEAKQVVTEAAFDFDDLEFENNQVDGVSVNRVEEI